MFKQLIIKGEDIMAGKNPRLGPVVVVGRGESLIDWADQGVSVVAVRQGDRAPELVEKMLAETEMIVLTQEVAADCRDMIGPWNQGRGCVLVLPTPAQRGLGQDLISQSVKQALGIGISFEEETDG